MAWFAILQDYFRTLMTAENFMAVILWERKPLGTLAHLNVRYTMQRKTSVSTWQAKVHKARWILFWAFHAGDYSRVTSSSESLGDVRAIVGRGRSSSSSESLRQKIGVRKETSKRAKKVMKDNSSEHEREIFALVRLFFADFSRPFEFPSRLLSAPGVASIMLEISKNKQHPLYSTRINFSNAGFDPY